MMKVNLFKLYLLSFFVLSDFIMFAQPGEDDPGGGLEDDDPPAAPINGKLMWLLLLGIVYGIYSYNRYRKLKKA